MFKIGKKSNKGVGIINCDTGEAEAYSATVRGAKRAVQKRNKAIDGEFNDFKTERFYAR